MLVVPARANPVTSKTSVGGSARPSTLDFAAHQRGVDMGVVQDHLVQQLGQRRMVRGCSPDRACRGNAWAPQRPACRPRTPPRCLARWPEGRGQDRPRTCTGGDAGAPSHHQPRNVRSAPTSEDVASPRPPVCRPRGRRTACRRGHAGKGQPVQQGALCRATETPRTRRGSGRRAPRSPVTS